MLLKDGGKTIELRIFEKNPMPDFGLKPGIFPDQIIVKQRNNYDDPKDAPYETVRYVPEGQPVEKWKLAATAPEDVELMVWRESLDASYRGCWWGYKDHEGYWMVKFGSGWQHTTEITHWRDVPKGPEIGK